MTKLDDNITRATGFLASFAKDGVLNQIGGQAVPAASGRTFEIISPVDLKPLAQVARGDAADVDAAARAAQAAFGAWATMPGADRRKILHRIADGIEARADEIAMVECMDTGQALRFMSKAALRGAENFRFFADNPSYVRMVRREAIDGGQHLAIDLASVLRPMFDLAADYFDNEMYAGNFVRQDPRQLLITGYGALLSYFSDEPFLEGLLDVAPLSEDALAAREEHIVAFFSAALVP